MAKTPTPPVAVIMGSQSDWKVMKAACETLDELGILCATRIVSAHRTPDRLYDFAKQAKTIGYKCIIAGAGGAAHLPGMTASLTSLPVIGVPVPSATNALNDDAAVKSILFMPPGIPVATMTIGGAKNAALFAARMLAPWDKDLDKRLCLYIEHMAAAVAMEPTDEPAKT